MNSLENDRRGRYTCERGEEKLERDLLRRRVIQAAILGNVAEDKRLPEGVSGKARREIFNNNSCLEQREKAAEVEKSGEKNLRGTRTRDASRNKTIQPKNEIGMPQKQWMPF